MTSDDWLKPALKMLVCKGGGLTISGYILGPSQDVTFFYTGYYLSELQRCAFIFSTKFILFSHLNNARHNLVIELCRAQKNLNFEQLFSTSLILALR